VSLHSSQTLKHYQPCLQHPLSSSPSSPARWLRIPISGCVTPLFFPSSNYPLTPQGVYVNGVDQGTGKGIRTPAYNGAPNKGGYNNGPVKDLSSIDLRCNVLGDIPAADTIKVVPGDHLTFDWWATKRPYEKMKVQMLMQSLKGITTTATILTTSSLAAITVRLSFITTSRIPTFPKHISNND
jgi:hypothetical protein